MSIVSTTRPNGYSAIARGTVMSITTSGLSIVVIRVSSSDETSMHELELVTVVLVPTVIVCVDATDPEVVDVLTIMGDPVTVVSVVLRKTHGPWFGE
jgi:hypothetical protein